MEERAKIQQAVIVGAQPLWPGVHSYIPKGAYIFAADAGWQRCAAYGIQPNAVLGDFDSAPPPDIPGLLRTPSEKDDTDTMLAIREALRLGAKSVTLLGCSGGSADHFFANLQSLHFLARNGAQNLLADEATEVRCVAPGELRLQRQAGRFLSVFAVGGNATGVTLEGVKYPLRDATLTPDFPLGVSNQFVANEAAIRHKTGWLLVMTANRGE